METNNLMVKEKEENLLENTKSLSVCTKNIDSVEAGKEVYNALEKCDTLLSDCVGKKIKIKDIYIEKRDIVEETGEIKDKYRTILFDVDGKTYATGSYGIYNAIVKMCRIFGNPTWEEGIEVEVAKKPVGDGKQSLTLLVK